MRLLSRVTTALFLVPITVAANDTMVTLGAGGLVPAKSSQISIDREDLEISTHQITIRYLFRNASDKDVDATVAFPLPELDGGTVEHVPLQLPAKTKTNFVDFEVRSAGKVIDTRMEVRAFHDGRDITERLRAAGLPISVNDEHFPTAVAKLTPAQRKQFEKDELVVSDEPLATPNRHYWSNWNTRVQFYWTQHFPAKATVEVQHQYRPVVGGSYIAVTNDGASRVKPYCGGPDTVAQIKDLKRHHPAKNDISLYEHQIQYILTTANNWAGPIRDFHLLVTARTAEDIVLTCMPGLKKIGPIRYELTRANFRPDRELDLLILTTTAEN